MISDLTKEELFELIPTGWESVHIADYIELVELEQNREQYVGYQYLFEKLGVLTQTDPTEPVYYTLTINECRMIERNLSWLQSMPGNFSNSIEINGETYSMVDLNSLKVNEYAALDYYITTDIANNIHRFASILYRKHIKNAHGNLIREPFDYDYEERANLFLDIPMSIVYCIEYFREFRLNTQKMFPFCFPVADDMSNMTDEEIEKHLAEKEEEEKEYENMNFRERAAYDEGKRKELLQQKLTWEYLILDVAGGDIVKAHQIYEFEVLYVFQMINAVKSK